MASFQDKLEYNWYKKRYVCVGLDPHLDMIPRHFFQGSIASTVVRFMEYIIQRTCTEAGCYKPQSSLFEALKDDGPRVLKEVVDCIRHYAPHVPIIIDAKRGDIESTNKGYVDTFFGHYGFDAVTVHPYLGKISLKPFLDCKDKGTIVLCRTSNNGSDEFQNLIVDGEPMYMRVARNVVNKWNYNLNCYFVIGATYPDELKNVRAIAKDMTFLIPGIGAQGGDLSTTVKVGMNSQKDGMIINSARGIIFANDPGHECRLLNQQIIHLRG